MANGNHQRCVADLMTKPQGSWAWIIAVVIIGLLMASCGGKDSTGHPDARSEASERPDVGVARSKEWIDAHPLTPTQDRLLDDCLEKAIGRRDLGEGSGPTPDDLASYERCGDEQGVLDRIRTVEAAGPVDSSGANLELAAEAECLGSKGWEFEAESPDDRGIVFWEYPGLDFNDAAMVTQWNSDRRACGVDVPDRPNDDDDHGD